MSRASKDAYDLSFRLAAFLAIAKQIFMESGSLQCEFETSGCCFFLSHSAAEAYTRQPLLASCG